MYLCLLYVHLWFLYYHKGVDLQVVHYGLHVTVVDTGGLQWFHPSENTAHVPYDSYG